MSEKGTTHTNSKGTKSSMKHGEEPTELLLALVWSPVETLRDRGLVEIYTGDGKVAIIFNDTAISPSSGLVPTLANTLPIVPESVGTSDKLEE